MHVGINDMVVWFVNLAVFFLNKTVLQSGAWTLSLPYISTLIGAAADREVIPRCRITLCTAGQSIVVQTNRQTDTLYYNV